MSSNVGRNLDDWLPKQKPAAFPSGGKVNYVKQFESATEYLRTNVHPEVEKGAAVNDSVKGMFLNNHGPEHVAAVIKRAAEILNASKCEITPYEGYLFLLAAHLHDTGNLFGRDKHEKGCREVMQRLGTRAGDDPFEKKIITDIAAAHGGRTDADSKDTISVILPRPEIMLLNLPVRVQFLAALLRLADELADDRARASSFAMKVNAVPEASKLYHHYSQSLHSVSVGEREIKLEFDLSAPVAMQLFDKKGQSTYLLDEIFERTLKMHSERMYCMRFLRPDINIDEIRVNISVFELIDERYGRELKSINYRLTETGYPSQPGSIHTLCPDLDCWTGSMLKEKLSA